MHESPYLRGGSDDIILTGHTFSDEPGVYIPDEVGHPITTKMRKLINDLHAPDWYPFGGLFLYR